jgi:hypothetical protein
MTSGQNRKRHERAVDAEHAAAEEPTRAGELPSPLLDHVMSETAAQLAEPEQLDPAVRTRLLEVARRFAGQPLILESTGAALFEALLATEFSLFAERPALLSKAAREVARVLLADPTSHRRVEHLWQTLSEEAA